MNRSALVVLVTMVSVGVAAAEDWTGVQSIPAPVSILYATTTGSVECLNLQGIPAGPPPCGPTTYLHGGANSYLEFGPLLPAGASAPESGVSIMVSGTMVDPNSPTGFSKINAQVKVTEFARSDTVSALQTQVGAISGGLLALEAQVNDLATTASVSALQDQVNGLATTASVSLLQEQVNGLATTASVSALQGQMNALATSISSLDSRMAAMDAVPSAVDQLDQRLGDMKRRSDENSVMASALSPMSPSDGKANRLGFNGAMIADQSALALNYTHVSGNIDVSAGVAVSGDSAMAKAGVGISW